MTIIANWSYPTSIRFGAGRISEIADACEVAGIKNPLLITDRGLADMDITKKTLFSTQGLLHAHVRFII